MPAHGASGACSAAGAPAGRRPWRLLGAALALAPLACATTQEIPLGCVEEEVQVFVDGRLLEPGAHAVSLEVDRPHKLYFKLPGQEPQLVVLEPGTGPDGKPRLVPSDPCVHLVPVGLDRELTIEVEEDAEP